MKAELIEERKKHNPLYSPQAHRAAKKAGKEYAFDPFMVIPVGTIIDHPDAWRHCVPGQEDSAPIAKPADDECRECVRKWMEEERPKHLEEIRLMALPDNLKRMSRKAREHVRELAESYGLLGVTEPVESDVAARRKAAADAKSRKEQEKADAPAQ